MWLSAPERIGGITVEQISYKPEVVANGKIYFRAADHLVPAIVATGLGFEPCDPPEGTDLPDLPKADPLRDGAIADQARELAQLRSTVDQQKTEISQLNAAMSMIAAERQDLQLKVELLSGQLADMQSVCEMLRDMVPAHALKKFDEKQKEEAGAGSA